MQAEYEIKVAGRRTGSGGAMTRERSRMSVINGGKYLQIYPSQEIVDYMKKDGWIGVDAAWKIKNGVATSIRLTKSGGGIKIRFDRPNQAPHIPIPTSDVGIATVLEGASSRDVCNDEKDGGGFLFHAPPSISIVICETERG